ncbi:hypothetical protein E4U16_003274 [Claviceps sp. LM84 group G4]|nr:hypothetical protein E4U33_005012 [Claviceps sp. LM78 group G4]KAG6075623.1 hypothetical protein E4U16_003274 [Claviceps sp. LM84 group G4]
MWLCSTPHAVKIEEDQDVAVGETLFSQPMGIFYGTPQSRATTWTTSRHPGEQSTFVPIEALKRTRKGLFFWLIVLRQPIYFLATTEYWSSVADKSGWTRSIAGAPIHLSEPPAPDFERP